jgi:3'(2'), 5'-bisphosphate nucleotidase
MNPVKELNMTDRSKLLDDVVAIAREAGERILEVYNRDDFDVEKKGDNSPLTAADLAAHRTIVAGLEKLTPDIPVHSEESQGITWEMRRDWQRYWLVDPLDGTKEFIKRNGEFTVNIALMENGAPVMGVVHVPVLGVTYLGGVGVGAFKEEKGERHAISVRALQTPVVMVASRSHGADKLGALETLINEQLGEVELANMGSSLKLCLVAEGKADIYPRLAPTSEWDTAAAHAVVTAAGGVVVNTAFETLRYNKEDILNPFFLVLGDSIEKWKFIAPALL